MACIIDFDHLKFLHTHRIRGEKKIKDTCCGLFGEAKTWVVCVCWGKVNWKANEIMWRQNNLNKHCNNSVNPSSLSFSGDGHMWSVTEIWALFQQLLDSSISISPFSVWHIFCHLRDSEESTSLRNQTPLHYTLPCWTFPVHHPHLPKRERTAATMVLSQRQRDELWVPGCKHMAVQGHLMC